MAVSAARGRLANAINLLQNFELGRLQVVKFLCHPKNRPSHIDPARMRENRLGFQAGSNGHDFRY